MKKATTAPKEAPPRAETTAAAAVEPPVAPKVETADLPSADELQSAWPAVSEGLKAGSRGMFRDGRFEVAGKVVVLTVPPGPPANLLEERRPELEKVLAAHFGRPVPVRLAVDAASAPPAVASPAALDDEAVDVRDLEDAPSSGTGVERLAEAFPGAELVDE